MTQTENNQNIQCDLQPGINVHEFVEQLFYKEHLPRALKDRCDYIYIYLNNYVVDQVCFYTKRKNVLSRYVKNTQLTNDNGRVWFKPSGKYMIYVDNCKLDDDVLYFIQYKPNGTASVYQAYNPGKLPRKGPIDRR